MIKEYAPKSRKPQKLSTLIITSHVTSNKEQSKFKVHTYIPPDPVIITQSTYKTKLITYTTAEPDSLSAWVLAQTSLHFDHLSQHVPHKCVCYSYWDYVLLCRYDMQWSQWCSG